MRVLTRVLYHRQRQQPSCAKPPEIGALMPTSVESTLTRWSDIPVEPLNPKIGRQFVVGTGTMLARVLLAEGAHVPLHSHVNEQITYILEGRLKFVLHEGDSTSPTLREVVVHAGEVLCIPPSVPHEAFALEDTVDLDIFNPPRQDWIDGTDAYLRNASTK
jgi:quercetin dioxygenase-like cupin family protein